VPSINSNEVNSELYNRVRRACHESGFIEVLRNSEAGPRGRGKIAIVQVHFKPVRAEVCRSRERSLPNLLRFQFAQVEAFRDGRVVPTWEIEDSPGGVLMVDHAAFLTTRLRVIVGGVSARTFSAASALVAATK